MLDPSKPLSPTDVAGLLRRHGVNPTSQRVRITHLLFERRGHVSAEDVYRMVNNGERHVSKATVYNTLGLLAEKGVIREVIADPERVFYDPNTAPHHHFYNAATGELMDIEADQIEVSRLPPLPRGADLEGVDVIVRLRRHK